jgi:prevent-host-death family protein
MATINMHDAKSQLSDLVARAEAGEEIVIARRNSPAVKLVRVERTDRSKRSPGAMRTGAHDVDWLEHASDDYISKQDIAAYYRKYSAEWDEMRRMVGFAEDEQEPLDLTGLSEAIQTGKEFTIMQGGKAVAKVVPTDGSSKTRRKPGALKGMFALPESFFDAMPQDEVQAWQGKYSFDPDK